MSTTANIPAQADILAAAAKLAQFLNQTQAHADTEDYIYLENLYYRAITLAKNENYTNPLFVSVNTPVYNDIIPAIDRSITSCRYTFGIVYAESQAKKAASAPQSAPNTAPAQTTQAVAVAPESPKTAPQPTSARATIAQTPANSGAGVSITVAEPAEQSSNSADDINNDAANNSQTVSDESYTATTVAPNSEPLEIPKTGGISQSSSILFIVLASLIAAAVATGVYFLHHRKSKYSPFNRPKRP